MQIYNNNIPSLSVVRYYSVQSTLKKLKKNYASSPNSVLPIIMRFPANAVSGIISSISSQADSPKVASYVYNG